MLETEKKELTDSFLTKYFRPWLVQNVMGIQYKRLYAQLSEDFNFKPDLSYFLLVKTKMSKDGIIWAKPIPGKGSGDLVNLAEANAFLELPSDRSKFYKTESFPLFLFR